jgi:hypothetical protein
VIGADIIVVMYTPPPDQASEPGHVVRHLADPIAAAWRAIDKGRAAADEFFAGEEHAHRAFDPHMWAHIVRYEAALSMRAEPEDRSWQLHLPHHSGIEFSMDGFRVKVCKAVGDGPQSPGRNRARRHFFQQFNLSIFGGPEPANLLLYWRVLDGDLDLGLCKPRGLWKFKGDPKLEWQVPVHYDPLAGLTFETADDNDLQVRLRLDDTDFYDEGNVDG